MQADKNLTAFLELEGAIWKNMSFALESSGQLKGVLIGSL
jgi:hypothetical protein